MTTYEALKQKHVSELRSHLPKYMERISWSREKIRAEQQERLRSLVRFAKVNSPWHSSRLSKINPDQLTLDEITSLPTMTKLDVMSNFDSIVTDKRLNLKLVNAHVSSLTKDSYLLDEFHAVASGGSSGMRGVFVYGWDAWLYSFLGFRSAFLGAAEYKGESATVAAEHASHLSSAMVQTFGDSVNFHNFQVTDPIEQIVSGLNELKPVRLASYPSMLYILALEARAERLRISPKIVSSTAEPLTPRVRQAARDAWHVPVRNSWAGSEGGVYAWSCGKGKGMHVNEDLFIIEPVDREGNPVSPGERASKIYMTNLFNNTLPLIRYELTDEVTFLPGDTCECGCAFQSVDDIQGRLENNFFYPSGLIIHPSTFWSILEDEPNILEYQVIQRNNGALIAIHSTGEVPIGQLRERISRELEKHGFSQPNVEMELVDNIERTVAGKFKKFVPLK
jgi:phenylacetate-CoA ligase